VVERLVRCGWTLATAESCTGGLLAGAVTDVPRASEVFLRGYVTYSNQAKVEALGVDGGLIEKHGAVSREVAVAMAAGALKNSVADFAVSTTGIAGPGGATAEKPVGLVFVGLAVKGGSSKVAEFRLGGSRAVVRKTAVRAALDMLLRELPE
jgi:nicotinamide-nucleotide amidase